MLSAKDLAMVRAQQEKSMAETVLVRRATLASDSQGGYTETWATHATTVGRIAPGSGNEQTLGERLAGRVAMTVWMPYDTDVEIDDRLQIGTRTLEILAKQGPHTDTTALGLTCAEIV